jgi:hypothetical protein
LKKKLSKEERKELRCTGAIEGSIDKTVCNRFKKRGMRWSIFGANCLLKVGEKMLNREWENWWCEVKSFQPVPSPATSPLYEAIPHRHTNRAAYDTTRSVDESVFSGINALVTESTVGLFWMRGSSSHEKFGAIAIAAAEALIADEQQSIDSHKWWRQDWDELQEKADGITLDAQGLGAFISGTAKFLPDMSRQSNDQAFVKNVREVMIPTAAAFGILAVRNGMDNTQRLQCGQAWQRIHLWGTTQGLAMQPLNQMRERADREVQLGSERIFGKAIADLLGDETWHGIMPFRIGYPTEEALLSPRRGLELVIASSRLCSPPQVRVGIPRRSAAGLG